MNPILPEKCFVPDAEARVMPDGRLYIYGSWDLSGCKEYCSRELHGFSTDDMVHWVDHGVIFENTDENPGVPSQPGVKLYAPDAIHKDGKYYLYLCGPGNGLGFEAMAVADSPVGPFSKAVPVEGADGDGIDPTVFVDDDGQAYYFWGQFQLRGGKLKEDMATLDPESIERSLLTEWEHGFHEGASIRKRGDTYYMVYTDISRGRATCLSYAMAKHPLGPYTKGGVIIDNIGVDPQTWNNHGSIECYKGQWYVFYHRSSQNGQTCRRVCAEPIFFDEDGRIAEVVPTSQGAEGPLNAFCEVRASRACRMKGECYIAPCGEREALVNCGGKHWNVQDWALYRYIDFGQGEAQTLKVKVKGKGSIRFCVEGKKEIARVSFDHADFEWVTTPAAAVEGVHALWLLLEGECFTVDSFVFEKQEGSGHE